MKKFLFCTFLMFVISCEYEKPQKDKYPRIPTFSEHVYKNPEKYGLKSISDENEDIEGFFIDSDRLILVSRLMKNGASSDSIVISKYTSFSDVKKYYTKTQQTTEEDSLNQNINLYQINYHDGTIYSAYHQFSAPDYKPIPIDSTSLKRKNKIEFLPNFASAYNHENGLEAFEQIPVGNKSNCGGGKLWGPIVCPIYLSYFKIKSGKKTISFKEKESFNRFKTLTIFGKKCLFYDSSIHGNSRLFLIEDQ